MVPDDRRYTKEHEWVQLQGKVATIGITHYAQDQLGDIVFVELPEVGKTVAQDDVIGTIESVKAVSDIYAPIAGKIAEINEALEQAPESVNSDPYGDGWYCRMELADPSQLDPLLDAAGYRSFVEE